MAYLDQPLVNKDPMSLTMSMKDMRSNALDDGFSKLKTDLLQFFMSKSISIPISADLMYFSKLRRKIYVVGSMQLMSFNIDTNEVELLKEMNLHDPCSITGNSEWLFIGTGNAELIQISYDTFDILKRVEIGKRNLYIESLNTSHVWAVSYGYTMYKYDIKNDSVYRLGSFPWASGLDVSDDEKYFCAFSDDLVRVFSTELLFDETEIKNLNGVVSVEFSRDGGLLSVAHSVGVSIWLTSDWSLLQTIKAQDTCFATFYGITSNVIYFNTHKISIWDPKSKKAEQEYVYPSQVESVRKIVIDEKSNFAYLINGTEHIHKHLLPCTNVLDFYGVESVKKGIFSVKSDFGYLLLNSGYIKLDVEQLTIVYEESDRGLMEGEANLEESYENNYQDEIIRDENYDIDNYCFSEDGTHIFKISNDKAQKINTKSLQVIEKIPFSEPSYKIKQINDIVYALSEECYWTINFETKQTIKVSLAGISPEDLLIVNGLTYVSHGSKVSCLRDSNLLFTENVDEDSVSKMFLTSKNQLLTIGTSCARVWSLSPFKELILYDFKYSIVNSCMNEAKNIIYVATGQEIHGFFVPDFVKFFNVNLDCNVYSIALADQEKFIIAITDESIKRIINPTGQNFNICSNFIDADKIMSIVDGTIDTYDPKLDSWYIFPFSLNSLHFYSYYNKHALLKQALDNGTPFITSSLGDPLQIVLEKNYRECTNVILSSLRTRVRTNLYALKCIEDKIPDLNRGSYKGLDELYDSSFVQDTNTKLPAFCSETTVLPKVRLADKIEIDGFLSGPELEGKSVRLEYYTTTIGVSFNVGSEESIDFLKSLKECENTDIFKTRFIKAILEEKWTIVFNLVLMQSFLYTAYLVCITLFISTRNANYLVASFILNLILLVYEVIQMFSGIVDYICDIWNWIDTTKTIALIVYCIYHFWDENIIWLLYTLTVLSLIRGITLFRLFPSTRYMISLLGQVIQDIVAFSFVLFYSSIAFTLLSMTIEDKSDGFFENLAGIYQLQIGAFEINETAGILRWITFLSSTFLGLVIMMNLLISVLGDTYSKVQESAEIEDLRQLIEIILEIENLCFWNKQAEGKKYIQVCDCFRVVAVDNSVIKKINKVKAIGNDTRNIAKALVTPEQAQKMINESESQLKEEIERSKLEVLNTLSEIRIKVLELSMAKGEVVEVGEDAYVPVCLKGHLLSQEARSFAFCDLCKQFVGTSSMCCQSCNFDMCPECVKWNQTTKKYKDSTCSQEHELRETKVEDLKPPGVEVLPHICRCCNSTVEESTVLYCRYCAFALCLKCREVINKSKSIMSKTKCKKSHELKWTIDYHYKESSNILNCSECRKKYLGAGTFSCTSCKYNMCIPCFRKKYT